MQKFKLLVPLVVVSGLLSGAAACGSDPTTIDIPVDSGVDATPAKDAGADTSVAVTYAVGGTFTGLVGNGLMLDNNGDTVTVAPADKGFVFPKKLAKGATYKVTAKAQPGAPAQTCVVTAGEGTVAGDVTTVRVDCTTNTYGIEVNVAGLEGTGLVLQNNAADDLTVAPANPLGPVKAAFATKIASGKIYDISIKTQPKTPGQLCTVSGGKGTVVAGTISTVTVNCATSYTIGGTVTGLTGNGLTIENNAGDTLPINANNTFAFATPGFKGDKYAITIKANPTTPSQTCVITQGTEAGTIGTANVTTIAIVCTTNKYAISGTITGLTGKGAVLQNNGGDSIALAAGDSKFAFPTKIDSGASYTVTVGTQPNTPTQTCVVTNGGPAMVAAADVTNVTLACSTNKYAVTTKITGIAGGSLVLQNNGGDDLTVNADGTKSFATKLNSGSGYAVTIKSKPAALMCTITGGTGTLSSADAQVTIVCSTAGMWVQANYSGNGPWTFVSATQYNGTISCGTTCAFYGRVPSGIRFVCNAQNQSTEGCGPANDGKYGTANCGAVVDNDVLGSPNGNTEQCAGSMNTCYKNGNSCTEGVTYHSIECQCK